MTSTTTLQVSEKIAEINEELRRLSLWKPKVPDWVHHYKEIPHDRLEFSEWLQFVFLPNKLQVNKNIAFGSIAPQAAQFFGKDISKEKLLQLLVELDSLT